MTKKNSLTVIFSLLVGLFTGSGTYFYTHQLTAINPFLLVFFILLGIVLSFGVLCGSFTRPYLLLGRRSRIFSAVFSVLLSLIMTVALKPSQSHSGSAPATGNVVWAVAAFLFVFLFILGISWLILTFSKNGEVAVGQKRYILIYALLPLFLSLIYFWAFYPGILVIDSVNQWQQAHSTFFNDWHPVMMTWMILLTTKVWDNPAAFVILQFMLTSVITGYVIYAFRSLGVNRRVLIGGWLFLSFFPMNALYSVIIWKDTLYCYFLLLLTTLLILVFHSKGGWLKSTGNLILLYSATAGMVFFRHNGPPVLLASLVVLLFFFRKNYWRMHAIFAAAAITFLIVNGPVFNYFHVYPSDKTESLGIPIQQIGGVIKGNGKMSSTQKDFFSQMFPAAEWKKTYQPAQVDPVKFHKGFNKMIIRKNPAGFAKNWAGIVVQNPKLATSAFLSMEQLVYKLDVPQSQMRPVFRYKAFSNYRPVYFLSLSMIKADHVSYKPFHYSEYGAQNANTSLATVIKKYNHLFLSGMTRILILPAFYLYLTVIFLLLTILKGRWKLSLAAVPAVFNLASMAAAIPAQDPRYLFSNYLLIVPFFFLATLAAGKREPRV
jgi:hypothetical protein